MVGMLGWLIAGVVSAVATLLFVPKELWRRWRARLVDRLDLALRRRVSRFDRRYREFLLGHLRFIDLKGLPTIGFYTPELDEVFVDVSLAYRAPHQVSESVLAEPPVEVTDRFSIDHFLDREQPKVLAVIGVPGSGKTTLLRHTARTVCREQRTRRRAVPVLIYLRDHVATIVADRGVDLPALVRATLGRYGPDEPPGWFEQQLRAGHCVVLLDGLDEVARPEDRRTVAAWVERQTRQYPKNDFVITSRPHGYRTASVTGAIVLQVRSFTDEQVSNFVHRWYFAVEKHSTGASGDDIRLRAEAATDDLLERLNGAPGLYELTVNPLLLTMIANVHRFRGALPGSRADLYAEICQVMLWRRQEAKDLPTELRGDKKEALLRGLAFTMMQRRVRDLPRTDVLDELKPTLRRISTQLTEDDFLTDVSSNGLLVERESGLYSFAHLTFQEYLAARYIQDKGLSAVLADAVDDVWWRETTLLYAAHSDADPIVRACLDSGSVTALSLAFDYALQGSELSPELRGRLDALLDSAFTNGADPEERRALMARVLLTRHLRQSIRTSTGGSVCPRPITSRLYWLFLQDATSWPNPVRARELTTTRDEPIVGVRHIDAAGFISWVNKTLPEANFRLPKPREVTDAAVARALRTTPTQGVWLAPDKSMPTTSWLWMPNGGKHPHAIDAETFAAHLERDFAASTHVLTRLLVLRSIVAVNAILRSRDTGDPQELAQVRELGRRLVEVFEPAATADLEHSLDRSFYDELALHRIMDDGLVGALDLTRTLVKDAAQVRTLQGLGFASTLIQTRDLAPDSKPDLLTSIMGFNAANIHDAIPGDTGVHLALSRAVGTGLSSALASALNRRPAVPDWSGEFARSFLDVTRTAGRSWMVQMDGLPHALHAARRDLSQLLAPEHWAAATAGRLERLAAPIVARKAPITPGAATAARVGALCLAAETDERGLDQAGDLYRAVAAGVTLLERRASGQAPVLETIILATDDRYQA
jgi:NACHT domain